MINHAMTVKELAKITSDMVKNSLGDKRILISSDDEWNSVHCLWGEIAKDKDDVKLIESFSGLCGYNADEVVIFG